jgi:hypothetical protein
LWKKVQDCREKAHEHRELVKSYAAWNRALTIAAAREQVVELDVEDVEFFGL